MIETRQPSTLPAPAAPRPEARGTEVDLRYVRYEALGTGLVGTVYRGKHTGLGFEVAIKEVKDLFVVDGSVLPTSLGVNPQVSVMAMATHLGWKLRERPLC